MTWYLKLMSLIFLYRLTSSALWAIKNPWVFAKIFTPRGLIEILLSFPSSPPFISIARSRSFNFVKQSLWNDIRSINKKSFYKNCLDDKREWQTWNELFIEKLSIKKALDFSPIKWSCNTQQLRQGEQAFTTFQ